MPVANLVGAEHEGWSVAKTLLTFERSSAYAGRLMTRLAELKPLIEATQDGALARRFAELSIDVEAIQISEFRIQSSLAGPIAGRGLIAHKNQSDGNATANGWHGDGRARSLRRAMATGSARAGQ